MNAVEIKNVSKYYQEGEFFVKAIDGIDLSISRGEFAVLAGPSGSGKSTLLNLIGGLDRPDKGEIFLDGLATREKSDDELTFLRLHKIGFVFQAYNLVPVLTAFENVQFILQIQGVPEKHHREKILALFAELGISGLENRFPPQLSGGQQQRVAVARAIVGNPAIVLADEPTANLDSESALSLLGLMKQLNKEKGVTFLFSSHDSRVVETASRVIKLRDGKIEPCGLPLPQQKAIA
ncbi:MAG: ABC transporter ATP-binding protein [Candidatus Riflebacteria bacterium]|nr:ABC transporter ATP-binding protein [Candidatus Riflebacteria bacterium]